MMNKLEASTTRHATWCCGQGLTPEPPNCCEDPIIVDFFEPLEVLPYCKPQEVDDPYLTWTKEQLIQIDEGPAEWRNCCHCGGENWWKPLEWSYYGVCKHCTSSGWSGEK